MSRASFKNDRLDSGGIGNASKQLHTCLGFDLGSCPGFCPHLRVFCCAPPPLPLLPSLALHEPFVGIRAIQLKEKEILVKTKRHST